MYPDTFDRNAGSSVPVPLIQQKIQAASASAHKVQVRVNVPPNSAEFIR